MSEIVGTLNVDWDTYTLFDNPDSSQLVNFNMPDDNSLLIPGSIAVSDSSKYHAKTKAVFIVKNDTVKLSFFMKVIEEGAAAGYQPVLNKVHYRRIPTGFTGKILYFNLSRQFINGYNWLNGSIAETLSIGAVALPHQQTQSIAASNQKRIDKLSCESETYEVWAIRIFSDGTVAWDDHLYDIVVISCTSDGSEEGGGGGGSGGGVVGDTPPPPCGPLSQPVADAVKGKIIVNVYQSGDTGGGGNSGVGSPQPCPTGPNPPPDPPTANIINNVKNPCLNAMVDAVINKNIKGDVNSLIENIFGSPSNIDLTFTDQAPLFKSYI